MQSCRRFLVVTVCVQYAFQARLNEQPLPEWRLNEWKRTGCALVRLISIPSNLLGKAESRRSPRFSGTTDPIFSLVNMYKCQFYQPYNCSTPR
jgi:hypothetical protein